jgi:hypothetical protein
MPILKPYRGMQLNMSHPLARGLVACLPMSEGTGCITFDSSRNNNICELQTNPQWKSGWYGNSIEFDGSSDFGSIDANSSLDFLTSSFSVVWMMKFPITQNYAYAGIIADQNWNSSAYNTNWWGIVQNSTTTNSLKYYDEQDGTVLGSFDNNIAIDSNIPDGWHHFAFVRDAVNKRFKFYRDSKLVYDASYANQTNLMSHGLYIARVESRYTGGMFEDVKIYKRALSAVDIAWLFQEPFCMFERPVNRNSLCVSFIDLTGTLTAQSTASATVRRVRRIKGSSSAASDVTAVLKITGEVLLAGSTSESSDSSGKLTLSYRGPWLKGLLKIERQWLTDVLFNGMTANAFKLGTILTRGWFWMRPTSCTALYRGLGISQIDFTDILTVVEQNENSMSLPCHTFQNNDSKYFYVIRRFNSCGCQELTLQAAIKVSVDADGNLQEPRPNNIFAWRAEQIHGNKARLLWFYSPIEQKSQPVCFKIYYNGGTEQIDFENTIAEISYKGQKFYSWHSDSLAAGRYLFAIRAEDADGIHDYSFAQLALEIIGRGSDVIDILKIETL